jgi:hypothetical protein
MLTEGYFKYVLKENDEIILSYGEHASNVLPWFKLAKELNLKIVYLPLENNKVTIENLKSIIAYKQQNPDKVVLLLGNHDLHYFSEYYYELAGGNRYSPHAAISLQRLFQDNHHLFQLAWETELCDRHILFSHAGITLSWLKRNINLIRIPDARHLNRLIKTDEGLEALAQVGEMRGGDYPSGSLVWAVVEEMLMSAPIPKTYQIVGHSMQFDGPIITDKFACLDCRAAFLLDNKGKISPVT